jgi:hypothetical protein
MSMMQDDDNDKKGGTSKWSTCKMLRD